MRITSKGQVTIPKHIRDAAGLRPHTEALFELVEGGALIRPAPGRSWEEDFAEWLRTAPRTDKAFTPHEIMAITRGED